MAVSEIAELLLHVKQIVKIQGKIKILQKYEGVNLPLLLQRLIP